MKKRILKLEAICIALMLCACGNPTSDVEETHNSHDRDKDSAIEMREEETEQIVQAESDEWKQAYTDYVMALSTQSGADMYTYYLIYLDDDSIPELFVTMDCEAAGEIVATYYHGEVIDYQLSRIGSCYIEKSGMILTDTGHMDYYPLTITRLKNGAFTEIASGVSYLSEEDNMRLANGETDEYILTYEWKGHIVSAEEFNERVNNIFNRELAMRPADGYSLDGIISVISVW